MHLFGDRLPRRRGTGFFSAKEHVLDVRAPKVLAACVADSADEIRREVADAAGVHEIRRKHVMDERLCFTAWNAELADGNFSKERSVFKICLFTYLPLGKPWRRELPLARCGM